MKAYLEIIMLALITATASYAYQPVANNPLETHPTHWDEAGVWKATGNLVLDTRDGRIQAVSQLNEGPFPGTPEAISRQFLEKHAAWCGFEPTVDNLRVTRISESPAGTHVTFARYIDGIPVYPGAMKITIDKQNHVRFYFSSLYVFDDTVITANSLSGSTARQIAISHLNMRRHPDVEPELDKVIWAGDNENFVVCWRVRLETASPVQDWEIVVDANSGEIRRAKELTCYVDGHGYAFDPDPITTAEATHGDPGFVDNNDADSPQLTAERQWVTLQDILFFDGMYHLIGPWCTITDFEPPDNVSASQSDPDGFQFTRNHDSFEHVMCYYHVNKTQNYLQDLGLITQNFQMSVDPHGLAGDTNAHYLPQTDRIAFGDGCIDAAEDAEVILHEYGHGMTYDLVDGWGGGDQGAMGEGFGDYWGASYTRSLSLYNLYWTAKWYGHNECWDGRVLNMGYYYPDDANHGVHESGQLWSEFLFDINLSIGRTVGDKLAVVHMSLTAGGASMPTAAQAVITTDQILYGGSHETTITNFADDRGFIAYPGSDSCPEEVITEVPFGRWGTTAGMANNYDNCVDPTSPDIVYELQTSCEYSITVSLEDSEFDTGLEIRTGGSCPGNTQVACNDDHYGLSYSRVTFDAQENQSYYIIIHGANGESGIYYIAAWGSMVDQEADDCSPVYEIASLPFSYSGSTECYEDDMDVAAVNPDTADVLFKYTATECGMMTASLCGSSFNTVLEVRRNGWCTGSGEVFVYNDDYCGEQSQVTFEAHPDSFYFFIIDGQNLEVGDFVFTLTQEPIVIEEDQCPGQHVTNLPFVVDGSFLCATDDYPHACAGWPNRELVYWLDDLDCYSEVAVELCGSDCYTSIEVYENPQYCPGDLDELVTCTVDGCADGMARATFTPAPGATYYIVIAPFGAGFCDYYLEISGTPLPPDNRDTCPGRQITALPYTDSGNTSCMENEWDVDCTFFDATDAIYYYTPTSCVMLEASLCGSSYDTGIEVRMGGECPGSEQVACNDDECGIQSRTQFAAYPGNTYYIIVDGYNGAQGPYEFSLSSVGTITDPSDDCPGTIISALPFTDTGNTRCANNDYEMTCVTMEGRDVVYSMMLEECYEATASLCGSNYNTALEVRRGGFCPGDNLVRCNDDFCDLQSQVNFTIEANETYYFIIDGDHASGEYVFGLTGTLCNAPDAPENLVIWRDGDDIRLEWVDFPGAASYEVYRIPNLDTIIQPRHMIGTPTNSNYVDADRVISIFDQSFYFVVAVTSATVTEMEPSMNQNSSRE